MTGTGAKLSTVYGLVTASLGGTPAFGGPMVNGGCAESGHLLHTRERTGGLDPL